ncbi:hypothetical protein ID866_11087 [Astraeus odoratus]|nr:hypothetical protein ID866_11087 [Astraeus odoratus]
MKINTELCFLFCQLCQEAVPTKEVQAHLVNKHVDLSYIFDNTCFENAIKNLVLASELPIDISGPRKPIHGLAIHEVLACDNCSSLYTSSKVMREHHMDHHKDLPLLLSWRQCKAQRMKSQGPGRYHIFWEVIPEEDEIQRPSSQAIMVEKVMKELQKELDMVEAPSDQRLVSPWLLTTRWHEYVESLNTPIRELCCQVALPQPQEKDFETLINMVELYFQNAVDLIKSTDELVLQ